MSESVQSLLDRIHDESITKTQQECEKLLQTARDEAKKLVEEAKNEAAAMKTNAEKEVALTISKGKESLKQAARDTLLSLRGEMEKRLTTVVDGAVKAVVATDATLAEILKTIISEYMAKHGEENNLTVLLPAAQLKAVEALMLKALAADLKKNVEFAPSANLKSGFKLVFTGDNVVYDFSDDALTEALAEYLNPQLAALLTA